MSHNVVYVSQNINDENIWRRQVAIENLHWINGAPQSDEALHVRIRHRAPLISASLDDNNLSLDEPQRAITSGQSVVIYRADTCLGGGIVV